MVSQACGSSQAALAPRLLDDSEGEDVASLSPDASFLPAPSLSASGPHDLIGAMGTDNYCSGGSSSSSSSASADKALHWRHVDFQLTQDICELRTDVLSLVMSFLDVSSLSTSCALSLRFQEIASSHEHWRWFVLQFFGVYYDDYMRSVDVRDACCWRRLFVYIRQVHRNVDRRRGSRRILTQLLRPCAWLAEEEAANQQQGEVGGSSSSSSRRRPRRRRYRGSLELADNCNIFFWENGRTVQVVRAMDGTVLREIDTGQMFRRYFHRLANVKNRLFVCLNDCIKVWEVHDDSKPPIELPRPRRLPTVSKVGRPLELLVHRRRLVLLESNCCLLWDTETFEFVCCIQHEDSEGDDDGEIDGSGGNDRNFQRSASDNDDGRALEVQWMGDLIVTWVRSASRSLKVWTLDGQLRAHLLMDSPLVQVDVARVTWVSVKTLDHFILSALDMRSVVSLWDSKRDFNPIFRFYCGCEEPFDLVLTQDFMAVVNDNMADNCLELCFWKLWLHPNFEDSSEALDKDAKLEAAKRREATLEAGGSPAGARFSLAATGTNPHPPPGTAAALGAEALRRLLLRELKPNARPIKTFSIPDIDSYFASYRNFLNVCSFHKSGQESLSVYRSSSLQKKIFFPPAKHTKFEEWLALQVQNDGTVVVHDFRPSGVAFDELPVRVLGAAGPSVAPKSGGRDSEAKVDSSNGEAARPPEPPRHGRHLASFGSRSRGG